MNIYYLIKYHLNDINCKECAFSITFNFTLFCFMLKYYAIFFLLKVYLCFGNLDFRIRKKETEIKDNVAIDCIHMNKAN